jgi:hypothetical protein
MNAIADDEAVPDNLWYNWRPRHSAALNGLVPARPGTVIPSHVATIGWDSWVGPVH